MSVLFILLMHLVNGAQFSNVAPLFLFLYLACLSPALSPALVIVIVPLTSMYECHIE